MGEVIRGGGGSDGKAGTAAPERTANTSKEKERKDMVRGGKKTFAIYQDTLTSRGARRRLYSEITRKKKTRDPVATSKNKSRNNLWTRKKRGGKD